MNFLFENAIHHLLRVLLLFSYSLSGRRAEISHRNCCRYCLIYSVENIKWLLSSYVPDSCLEEGEENNAFKGKLPSPGIANEAVAWLVNVFVPDIKKIT